MSLVYQDAGRVFLTPLALHTRGRRVEKGFIDVFTTSPKAPWSARFEFEGDVLHTDAFELPSSASYDCLCMQAYVYYTSAAGRLIPNHCGYAYVCATDRDDKGVWTARFQYTREERCNGLQLTFRLTSGKPAASVPFPEGRAADGTPVKDVCKRLTADASVWYKSREPLAPELVNVHVPSLPCPFPWLPGFLFAALRPVGSEDERLFQRALAAAASRRRWVVLDVLRGPDAGVLVVEALAAVPNCYVYNEDCRVDADRGRPSNDEAFYADERTIGNGDCEDAAHELVNVAYSLRTGSWTSEAVVLAQRVLLSYVVAEQLAGVNMEGAGADVSQYRALPNDPTCSIFAHAFVLFLPARWVAGALQRGGSGARLAPWVHTDAQETMSADGIALFAARALAPFEALEKRFDGGRECRVSVVSSIGRNYYKYVTSCMLVDRSVVCEDGSPVYEMGYLTGDRYGARFVDVVEQTTGVSLVPVLSSISPADDDIIRRCATYFHPIAPMDASDAAAPDLRMLEETLQAKRVNEPPLERQEWCEFYIQGGDAQDERHVRRLARRLRARYAAVEYMLDYFAKDTFTVHVFAKEHA